MNMNNIKTVMLMVLMAVIMMLIGGLAPASPSCSSSPSP